MKSTENDVPVASTFARTSSVTMLVNGAERSLVIRSDKTLLHLLRDDLGLTGAKVACEVSVCGACTVLVDGRPTSSCVMLAVQADGRDVVTVEGLDRYPETHALRNAFIDEGGFQCGYCTSGQIVAAISLLLRNDAADMSADDVKEYMVGNLCRCTGYYGILRAIESVRG
jgi:aerobic-type carbon monoxide dehydrogenase small subunit (CoxS/CutS family)